jgi:gamma-glutamyltranspeptidase/glutathione hydrolase
MNRRQFITTAGLGLGASSLTSAQQVGDTISFNHPQLEGKAHRVVWGRNGAVATADQHGSLAGLRILMNGGNAIDAIVAAAAALNVAEPYMSGMGGFGGFMLIYLAAENKVVGLDMMGTSPSAARLDMFTEKACDQGYLAPIVPGALKGWAAALDRYGTKSLGDCFEPAIELAERGFVISKYDELSMRGMAGKIGAFPTSARVFLPHGRAPRMGEVIKQKDLARSFRRVALHGADIFYKGELGTEIVNFLQRNGGILLKSDFENFDVRWRKPITTDFLGHKLYAMPPGSCGLTMFQILNIMEGFGLNDLDLYSTEFAHHWLESAKLAFKDDDRYNTGKEDADIPVEQLISKAYADQQRKKIDATKAAAFHGPLLSTVGTTSLAAADRWGNAVAFTQSLVSGFGSGVIAGDTGIFLNNGHRYGFVLSPSDHANLLEPGKHAKGVMTPAMVMKGDKPLMAVGAAGGYTIPQTVGQVITKVLGYGMDVQHAIASPRMMINRSGGRPPIETDSQTYLELGFPANVFDELRAMGHNLVPPGNAGGVQGVYIDPETGSLAAGADPRRDGHALTW